jgi:hypothetical protein
MQHRFVTCPETAHLEKIGYVDSPLGMLITSCSRYEPRCDVQCTRTCAAHFDLRERLLRSQLAVGDTTETDIEVDFG